MTEPSENIAFSVIIPVYNERESLPILYERLTKAISQISSEKFEILFVDDGSHDGSLNYINELCERDRRVRGVSLSRNFGHQIALTCGLDYARGTCVIMMDADLQHPPELIGALIEKWKQGYDIVYTLREDAGHEGLFKRLTSKIFYGVFEKISGQDLPFGAADFRLLGPQAVTALCDCRERIRFLRGLVSWIGYKKIGIPYQPEKRLSGRSKYSFSRMFRFASVGITSFSSAPLTVAIFLGVVIACLSFLYALFALYIRLFTHHYVPGWTSILISVLFLGGVQLIAIGVVGLYLANVYEEVKQRPLYFVKTMAGFKKNA